MKSFLIIGMGSFGHHLCKALAEQKCEVMIADLRGDRLEDMLPYVVSSKIGDCTNTEVLRSFGVDKFDACFVCVGGDFQNSLQITSLLKELGAKLVYSKADEDVQAKFLLRNGADEVIYPEKEAAMSIAISVASDSIFDSIELTKDYMICEISAQPGWIGKTIGELNFRSAYNLSILAVKDGENVSPLPTAAYRFSSQEHIIVLGHMKDIKKVARY